MCKYSLKRNEVDFQDISQFQKVFGKTFERKCAGGKVLQ